ncbi:C-type lectin domain family 4 member E-like [Oreochromis aureus]|uniref:C-type lectin domain family 4 member E-like n=1 Tax=Oreochromis aureus TaxID=47969 RepID=UPI0019547D64|nr:C-type lectin domain family 4 member E-like [Oreochromis aureus]
MYAMEEMYASLKYVKPDNSTPSTNHTGQRNSESRFYLVVILSLALLAGVITVVFFYHFISGSDSAEQLSAITNQLSSMTEERDLLQVKLTEKATELERLQSLFNQSVSKNETCPVGWSSFSHSCYHLPESFRSWDAARKDCRDRGADLMVIDSAEKQTFLSMITTKETWIGLNDKEQEGTWKWVDGTPLTLMYWGKSQPNNGGEQDCVYVRTDEGRFWNDHYCSSSHQWICENTPNHNKTCPVGWSFNHSCYLVSKNSASWDAARKDCRDRGADLVVINSPEEKNFLSTITTEGVWIGLNDKEEEGTWKWVDGTPLTLMYWATEQPNNGGEEDCVSVRSEKNTWFDRPCSYSYHWICEKVSENN